jgi:hypothetical protein
MAYWNTAKRDGEDIMDQSSLLRELDEKLAGQPPFIPRVVFLLNHAEDLDPVIKRRLSNEIRLKRLNSRQQLELFAHLSDTN